MTEVTHRYLCERAASWLLNKENCMAAFPEPSSFCCIEKPDALGVKGGFVYAIECKRSVQDFRRDSKKGWKQQRRALGNYRYYLLTEEVFRAIKFSDIPRWFGVLVIKGRGGIRIERQPERLFYSATNIQGAFFILAAEWRRIREDCAKDKCSDAVKSLKWAIRTIEGDSGAGANYWENVPEYKSAKRLLKQHG